MTKQVIVVVHGVGVKQAGVSSDLVGAALQGENGSQTRLPPHSTDDFLLLEDKKYDRSNKACTFPARIRRYRSYENGQVKNERVIADFFWGDVTAFGSSVLGAILAYFRVAMGLSHAVRENAREIYPGNDSFLQKMANGAALTIHGPIIAINVVLLVGLALVVGLKFVGWTPSMATQVWLIGLLAIAGGLWFLLFVGGSYLFRHLMGWIAIGGVLFLLVNIAELFHWAEFGKRLDNFLIESMCSLADSKAKCREGYVGIVLVGLRYLALMYLFWAIFSLLSLTVMLVGLPDWIASKRKDTPHIVVPALGLMALLWILLISAVWQAILKLPNVPVKSDHVSAAVTSAVPAVATLVLLGLVSFYVLIKKWALKKGEFLADPSNYLRGNGALASDYAERYRLIVRPAMLWSLTLFGLALLLLLIVAVLGSIFGEPDWVLKIRKSLFDTTGGVVAFVFVAGSFLVYSMRAEFNAGLGILADVLAYLNNGSWNLREGYQQTWLERLLPFGPDRSPSNDNPQGYWLRNRIQDRLVALIEELRRDEAPDRLDIVSHSQGTVIAIDVIAAHGKEWLNPIKDGAPHASLRLVTMGSPYTHLYRRYFPSSFEPPSEREGLSKVDSPDKGPLTDWINIFRVDDFVGTHIGDVGWPVEHAVHANGHTNYWIDRNVVAKLREFLKF